MKTTDKSFTKHYYAIHLTKHYYAIHFRLPNSKWRNTGFVALATSKSDAIRQARQRMLPRAFKAIQKPDDWKYQPDYEWFSLPD